MTLNTRDGLKFSSLKCVPLDLYMKTIRDASNIWLFYSWISNHRRLPRPKFAPMAFLTLYAHVRLGRLAVKELKELKELKQKGSGMRGQGHTVKEGRASHRPGQQQEKCCLACRKDGRWLVPGLHTTNKRLDVQGCLDE